MSGVTGGDFLRQNEAFRVGLDEDDYEAIHAYAEHHSGGLLVLFRHLDEDGICVKAHDSWGPGTPDEPGDIVVHVYDALDPEGVDYVAYFDNGHDALLTFLGVQFEHLSEPKWVKW